MEDNFLDSRRRKARDYSIAERPKSKGGSLGRNGQVYQNNLLKVDYTAGPITSKRIKES